MRKETEKEKTARLRRMLNENFKNVNLKCVVNYSGRRTRKEKTNA